MKMLASAAMAAGFLVFGASQSMAATPFAGARVEQAGATYGVSACPTAVSGYGRCHVHVVTNSTGAPISATRNGAAAGGEFEFTCQSTNPAECLGPGQLRAGYNITGSGKSTTTVAIVDAFAYPNAAADLAAYRTLFGLPACGPPTCLRIINQNGGSTPPAFTDAGWDLEQALDLDMVSTMCPNCHILLVQATTNSFNNLAVAVNQAVAQGAHVVSNSYGGGENGTQSYEPYYNHPGVAITASAGDSGYGAQFPATSPHVTAVGGTSLYMDLNSRVSETTWAGTGSGCSAIYAMPYWQAHTNANMANNTLCTARMEADVSAVASGLTPVLVRITTPPFNPAYYYLVYGTSVAAPLIGGIYGERDDVVTYGSGPYKAPSSAFHDITTGSNGACGTYWCNGEVGYDGPTGLGTPNGDTAF